MRRTLSFALLLAATLIAGCTQNSADVPPPVTGTPMAAAPPAAAPPQPPAQPQGPTLYIVPMDQRDFSMEKIQDYKKRAESNPKDAEALEMLGNGNFMIQRLEKAQEYYTRALEADPKRATARLSLANVMVFLKQPDGAVQQLETLLKSQKDYAPALFNLGLIRLYSNQDTAGAKTAWTTLVQKHPNNDLAMQAKQQLEKL